ncbi:MAG: DUF3791 domain-containing protein [Prevotellaceae bacterium]|jgi:hypothetical protein|nr:DUF3791 domain-containing protein [Prevotellaceae bacterium]
MYDKNERENLTIAEIDDLLKEVEALRERHTFALQINQIMDTSVLDEETRNKVSFITYIIPQFARAYKMNSQKAYRYLLKYGGMDFIDKHYPQKRRCRHYADKRTNR